MKQQTIENLNKALSIVVVLFMVVFIFGIAVYVAIQVLKMLGYDYQ